MTVYCSQINKKTDWPKISIKFCVDKVLSNLLLTTMMILTFFAINSNIVETGLTLPFPILPIRIFRLLCFLVIAAFILAYRFNKAFLAIILPFFWLYFANATVFPENDFYFRENFIQFLFLLPIIGTVFAIKNYDYFLSAYLKVSYIVSFFWLFLFGIIYANDLMRFVATGSNYMSFSYALLPYTLVSINDFCKNKNFLSFISALSLLSAILLFGARGPLLCVFSFVFFFYSHDYLVVRKKYFTYFFALTLLFLSTITFLLFAAVIKDALSNYGLKMRLLTTMERLDNPEKSFSSGRDKIYAKTIERISENPFRIRGINANYFIVGNYVHNFFLEIIYDLGILSLPALLLFLLFSILTIFNRKNDATSQLLIIFYSYSIPRLMVSGTYWTDLYFWLWFFMSTKSFFIQKYYKKCDNYLCKHRGKSVTQNTISSK